MRGVSKGQNTLGVCRTRYGERDNNEKSKEAENKAKYKNINIALITSIIMIFVGVTGRFIYRKIKN